MKSLNWFDGKLKLSERFRQILGAFSENLNFNWISTVIHVKTFLFFSTNVKVNYNAISLDLTLDFRFIKLSYTYYVTDFQKQ